MDVRPAARVASRKDRGEAHLVTVIGFLDTAHGEIPEETSGPYPGDGSNGANVLTESGIVRRDIT